MKEVNRFPDAMMNDASSIPQRHVFPYEWQLLY